MEQRKRFEAQVAEHKAAVDAAAKAAAEAAAASQQQQQPEASSSSSTQAAGGHLPAAGGVSAAQPDDDAPYEVSAGGLVGAHTASLAWEQHLCPTLHQSQNARATSFPGC